MYCANCQTEVEIVNGYCSRCGTAVNARLCPKGHVMDPAWSECQYCPPAERQGSAPPPPGSKGRTLVEGELAAGGPLPGGFVKGATLLEGTGQASGGKGKTVFDPGISAAAPGKLPRLAGWLVTFSLDPSGIDYRLREGRNTVGSDRDGCDVVIDDESVSAKHAVVMFRDGTFQIRDNDSTNGTYVNGEDIFGRGAVTLSDGDRVTLGRAECVLYTIKAQ